MKSTMKCAFLLLLAYLAVAALAAAPFYNKRNIELAPSANLEVGHIVEPHTCFAAAGKEQLNTYPDTEFANTTDAVLRKRDEKQWRVDIRVGVDRYQHIGSLRGARLKKKVIAGLNFLGQNLDRRREEQHTRFPINTCPKRPDFCKHVDPCCNEYYKIENIVYDGDNPNGKYVADAHMKMRMWWGEIYDTAHPGLRDLAYDLVASIIMQSTETEHSCFYVDMKNSRRTRFCNVPRNILVVIPSNGDDRNVEVRLNVMIEFNGKTANPKSSCFENRKYITNYFIYTVKPKIVNVMGYQSQNIHVFNTCQDESCFHTSNEYELGKPWKEPWGCYRNQDESFAEAV